MKRQTSKLNPHWVKEALRYFKEFLAVTEFPHPVRNGDRGSAFEYPEWLIMFIAVLSVKAKVKSYRAIHRLAVQYWDIIGSEAGQHQQPISERQLRDRLKKIRHSPGKPAIFISQVFPREILN